tara:strand:- start:88 stop:1617 length:1530 start_codon:yes stop_codon:yes gene_type:complete
MYDNNAVASASIREIELRSLASDEGNASRDCGSRSRLSSARRSEKVLGRGIFIDDEVEKRVNWAQRGMGMFGFTALLFYVLGTVIGNAVLRTISIVFAGTQIICFGLLYYKNTSLVIMKRLIKEPNVIIILVLGLCNWLIELSKPNSPLASLFGLVYLLCTYACVIFDAVILKSRSLVLCTCILFLGLSIYSVYEYVFGDWDIGVVLFQYSIDGEEYIIMKRSTQRSICLQILIFTAKGIYTMFVDKDMNLMMFITGKVYKKDVFQPSKCNKMTEIRVKWSQRGIFAFGLIGVPCYVVGSITGSAVVRIISLVFAGGTLICFGSLCYTNVSFVMLKRLLKEPNVVIILILGIFNLAIDVGRPSNSLSPVLSLIYLLVLGSYLFLDAVILKSRTMVLVFGIFIVVLLLYNLYQTTFGNLDIGVVLLQYNIGGKEYTIMKRSSQRSIYLQILSFSAQGMLTMLKDKDMNMMMFATGNIYRRTGTSSAEMKDEIFSNAMKSEIDSSRGNAIL